MDEARVGLIPTYRAMWAKKGVRPGVSSKRRYKWRYNYAFVHPVSGEMDESIVASAIRSAHGQCQRCFTSSPQLLESMRIAKWSLFSMERDGTQQNDWWCPMAFTSLSCHPIRQSYSPLSDSFLSSMRHSPTGCSPTSTNSRTLL